MNIELIYTIVPCADSLIAANFYKRIFNFKTLSRNEEDCIIEINEKLNFKLEECEEYTNTQFTFQVDSKSFDKILQNIINENILFGNSITDFENKKVYEDFEKKEFYLLDPNSHLFKIVSKIKD